MKKYYLAKIDMGLNEWDYVLIKAKNIKKVHKLLQKHTGKNYIIEETIK